MPAQCQLRDDRRHLASLSRIPRVISEAISVAIREAIGMAMSVAIREVIR